jgi:hypothetical protein
LPEGKRYRILKLNKQKQLFDEEHENNLLVAELEHNGVFKLRVYLTRIQGEIINDAFIAAYNTCKLADKLQLAYQGKTGKHLQIDIIKNEDCFMRLTVRA